MLRKQACTFFKNFLQEAGCSFDEDGTIRHFERTSGGGVKYPKVKIEGLDMVLPLKEQLSAPEGTNIIFAPLNENALAGESAVITTTKKLINTNIQYRLSVAMITLASLLVNKTTVKGKLLKLISELPEFSALTNKELIKLISRASRVPITRNLIGVYLTHKNQKFEGVSVKRLATVTSPLLDALNTDDDVWDIKMAKKHKEAIAALINAILPGLNDDFYTVGSNSHTAPYFDALGRSFAKVSERLGYVEALLREYQDAETLATLPAPVLGCKAEAEGGWYKTMEDFTPLAKAFPPLVGNTGNVPTGKEVSAVTNLSNVKIDEKYAGGGWGTEQASSAPAKTAVASDPWALTPDDINKASNTFGGGNSLASSGFGAAQPASGFGATQSTSGFGAATQSGFGDSSAAGFGVPNNDNIWR